MDVLFPKPQATTSLAGVHVHCSDSLAHDSDRFVPSTSLYSIDRLCHLEHTLGGVWLPKLQPTNELELCHHHVKLATKIVCSCCFQMPTESMGGKTVYMSIVARACIKHKLNQQGHVLNS